ncbi:hypothetical protein L9F63_006703, partial [Diploptera punctata]
GLSWRRHHDDGYIIGPMGPDTTTRDCGGLRVRWRKLLFPSLRTIPHQGSSWQSL